MAVPPRSVAVPSTVSPATNSTDPATGTSAVTVAVSVTRDDEPNTWLDGEAVSVVVDDGMPASTVSGSVTVVPLGLATSVSVCAPALVSAGIVTETSRVAVGDGRRPDRTSPSSRTSRLVFSGEPRLVRSSLVTGNASVSPAVTVDGTVGTPTAWRAKSGARPGCACR